MILSTKENVKPEPKPINDSAADNLQISPAIGNTSVGSGTGIGISVDFYNNALQFALNMLYRHDCVEHIDKMDIVHDAICDPCFCKKNWKGIIVNYVYRRKYEHFVYPLHEVHKSKDWIEHRYCKHCDNVMPEDYFISGYNALTKEWQYRTVCKYCYKQTEHYKKKSKKSQAEWYQKNKEKQVEKQREYRKKNVDKTAKERYRRFKEKQKALKLAS